MAITPKTTTKSATGATTRRRSTTATTARSAAAKTTSKTAAKTTARRTPTAAKKAVDTAREAPMTPTDEAVIASAAPAATALVLTTRELVNRVVTASGAKKKDVKPIAEALLEAIGAAMSRGEDLNLPPLGKVRIVKQHEQGTAQILTLKLRRPGAKRETAPAPLAEGGEEG